MTKRTITRIGDIFVVKIGKDRAKYFQLIAFDVTQLNSDVIRVFKKEYAIDAEPKWEEVVVGDVEFYAHSITRTGIKLGFWEKVGNAKDIGVIEEILFRGTEDYATTLGDEPISVSYNWYVWRIGDEEYTNVGALQGENTKSEIGLVFDPASIVHRIKTGEYPYSYPKFE